jgi:RNA polymerase sigma factor (TIGR02999 family)
VETRQYFRPLSCYYFKLLNLQDLSTGLITQCLHDWRTGRQDALDRLAPAVYGELRRLAASILGAKPGIQTMQPTELVHELYLRLPGVREFDWQSRAQFLNVAAKMMRNIIVDHARKRLSVKRGGGLAEVELPSDLGAPESRLDVLVVHDALDRFAKRYPRQAHVVELRFFGGLTAEEVCEVLKSTGIESSLRTVERDWTFAKAWLQNAIQSS